MKSIAYITGYTFGTAKSLISRIPQPDVDQIKADFKQAIADQQQPKPQPMVSAEEFAERILADEFNTKVDDIYALLDQIKPTEEFAERIKEIAARIK